MEIKAKQSEENAKWLIKKEGKRRTKEKEGKKKCVTQLKRLTNA